MKEKAALGTAQESSGSQLQTLEEWPQWNLRGVCLIQEIVEDENLLRKPKSFPKWSSIQHVYFLSTVGPALCWVLEKHEQGRHGPCP